MSNACMGTNHGLSNQGNGCRAIQLEWASLRFKMNGDFEQCAAGDCGGVNKDASQTRGLFARKKRGRYAHPITPKSGRDGAPGTLGSPRFFAAQKTLAQDDSRKTGVCKNRHTLSSPVTRGLPEEGSCGTVKKISRLRKLHSQVPPSVDLECVHLRKRHDEGNHGPCACW